MTCAEQHDRDYNTEYNDFLIRWVARWCAVHVLEGGTYWKLPCEGRGLYVSWLEAARVDRSLEIAGLAAGATGQSGFRHRPTRQSRRCSCG